MQTSRAKNGKRRILVTSALPYANGPIHVGHLVEYIQTDIFVRFLKLTGEDAIYCCADDTHGTAIEINAGKEGITPEQLIAKYFDEHTADFSKFQIHFDSYYTTNSPDNKRYSDYIFEQAKKKGLIYTKDVELTFCEKDKRFLPDRFVKGTCPKCGAEEQYGDVCEKCNSAYSTTDLIEPKCIICGTKPVKKKSMHYFFKLDALADKLEKWLKENDSLQDEVKNYVLSWTKEGLKDWDISRDAPYFGFKIPGEEDKYYYVWLDAPIGYISSTVNYCRLAGTVVDGRQLDAEKDYWKNPDAEIYHFIGKDIIYFHFLFWPALLMAAGFELPKGIYVHGFLNINGEKMSKSRGTFFTAKEILEKYDPSYIRYYFAANLSRKLADIDLNFKDLNDRVNNELVANIANFTYRVLSLLNSNFEGKIGKEIDKEMIIASREGHGAIKESYAAIDFREAVKRILQISSIGNKYLQDNAPWKLVKENEEGKRKAHTVVSTAANIAKDLCILVKPILPVFASELEKQFGFKDLKWNELDDFVSEHKVNAAEIIIRKIDEKDAGRKIVDEKITKHPDIEFEIDESVKKQGLKFFVAQINNISAKKKHEGLERLKREAETAVKGLSLDTNKIYLEGKKFYKDASFEPPYAYLASLIKEKGHLPNINTVVDSYNIVSLKHFVSAGAHDISRIKGKVKFTMTNGSEKYTPLGQKEAEKVEPGEYACMDDEKIICRLDIKQCEQTKVWEHTKNAMVYVQGNSENSEEDLRNGLIEICENIVRFCGGEYKILAEQKITPDFSRLNVKIGKVISVENHPNADKLIVMKIDLGTEQRQIVAGLKGHYTPEQLLGKKLCIVTNLERSKLRGIESQAMLLAGVDDAGNVGVCYAEESSPGEQVFVEGIVPDTSGREISFADFQKIGLKVMDGGPSFEGKRFRTIKEEMKVEKVKDGAKVR